MLRTLSVNGVHVRARDRYEVHEHTSLLSNSFINVLVCTSLDSKTPTMPFVTLPLFNAYLCGKHDVKVPDLAATQPSALEGN